jgi:hypothetical protein
LFGKLTNKKKPRICSLFEIQTQGYFMLQHPAFAANKLQPLPTSPKNASPKISEAEEQYKYKSPINQPLFVFSNP